MRLTLLAILLTALIAVAGCGGDDGGGNGGTATDSGTTEDTGQAITVSLRDFAIDPDKPAIDEPGPVQLRIRNDGRAEHNLEIEGPKDEAKLPNNLRPGESATLTVDLSRPGRYEWYCPVGNHRDLGMEGEVRIGRGGNTTTRETTTGETTGETGTNTTETQTTDTTDSGGGNSGSNSGSGRGY